MPEAPHLREAVVLAGGLGTRLRSVVSDRPKPMADVDGRPFVRLLLDQLEYFGVERAILCVGYLGHIVREQLGERHGGLALEYSFEQEPLGTGGALRNACHLITGTHALVMNGDSYCDLDLGAFAAAHYAFGGEATIAVIHRADRSRSGAIELDADGRVTDFAARPLSPGPGLVNAGIYMFRHAAIEAIPDGRFVSLESEFFPQMVERQMLFGWLGGDRFIDIGTPESYSAAQTFFRKPRGP